jgi:hypothetical protein
MRESIQDIVRVSGPWVGAVVVAIGLALELANFGLWPGLLYAALSLLAVLFVSLLAYSIWAARQIPRLRKDLSKSEEDRKAKEDRFSNLENVVQQLTIGAADIRQGTGLQRMLWLTDRLMKEIDIGIQYKRIEQAVGKCRFRVTQLAWDSAGKIIEAHVVFGAEPPFVGGQLVDFHMTSLKIICSGTVVRLDDHSATVHLDGQPLPAEIFDRLKTLITIDVDEAYVALPVLMGLEGYTIAQLDAIKAQLEETHQFLLSLLEGGLG